MNCSFALDFPPNDAIDWRFLKQKTIDQRKEMQFSRNNKQSLISFLDKDMNFSLFSSVHCVLFN